MGLSNTYFRFKQFNVEQAGCGMKVTTDACIQGAWTPVGTDTQRILDIGTGTGLLALMLAQRSAANVDALELDNDAVAQARENITASPWSNRILVTKGDAIAYTQPYKYDLIITNPPFFNNSLQGNNDSRNNARHTNTLTYNQLLCAIDNNLSVGGKASVLLPYPEAEIWINLLKENNWHIHNCLHVKHTDNAAVKRMIFIIGRERILQPAAETLVIKKTDGSYTERFSQLLAPYYLAL